MRCVIHDYAGHPFQVDLSRHLARRGHEVSHVYFADNPGPKGSFERLPGDPETLRFIGISLGNRAQHAAGTGANTGFGRRSTDVAYGRKVANVIADIKPDVVLSGNTPTEAQRSILKVCGSGNSRFVYWVQDIYSLAVTTLLTQKLGYAGKAIGLYYQHLDRQQLRASDAIVAISEDFVPLLSSWVGNRAKVSVIENWAAIDEIPVGAKDNDWSRQHGLQDRFTYLYSGTLGRKHNPALLSDLAGQCDGAAVAVVGQGFGIPQLQAAKETQRLDALKLLPIQPMQQLANLLATADVLIATIEPEASAFAVPSKVLSYLCAGRPILMASGYNLAAQIVRQAKAGIIVNPVDSVGFVNAATYLRAHPDECAEMGVNGRAYAERTFDIARITGRFEAVLR